MASRFTIDTKWDGSSTKHAYSAKVCIINGDLALTVDAPFFSEHRPPAPEGSGDMRVPGLDEGTIHIFISSGVKDIPEDEIEYLELIIGPYGHYYMIGCTSSEGEDRPWRI